MTRKKRFPSATQNRFRLERCCRAEGWIAVERASEESHLKTWMRLKQPFKIEDLPNLREAIMRNLVAKNFNPDPEPYPFGPWIYAAEWEIDLDGQTICISCRRTVTLRPG